MKTDEKIRLIEEMLLALRLRQSKTGIQWAKAFNHEESIRRKLDPSGDMYNRAAMMKEAVRKKLDALPDSSDLDVRDCEEVMSILAPNATCKFDGILQENAVGAYKALRIVSESYPEITQWISWYSSIKGAEKVNKKTVQSLTDELSQSPDVLAYKESVRKWKDEQDYDGWPSRSRAIFVARQYGVSARVPVKQWMREHGEGATATREFFDIVVNAKAETYIKAYVTKKAKEMTAYLPADSQGTYACASHTSKGVWMGNKLGGKRSYETLVRRDIEAGYHPPLDEEHDGATAVMVHELGHVLDYMTNAREDSEILAIWDSSFINKKKEISKYAGTNCAEMIAEAFAEYMLCKKPRELSKRIAERLTKLYEERYGAKNLRR